jgi:hypothetical protein
MMDTEEVLDRSASQYVRPTPDEIDKKVREYLAAKATRDLWQEDVADKEHGLMRLVQAWGAVPPNAEKSRRLTGRLAELTVTKSDSIDVNYDRVEMLREALVANGRGDFFKRLFTLNSKYQIVDGAESALKEEALSKRLAEKVLNLFGRCITVKAKKPSLKVTIVDPAKPAKKPRTKKAGQ